MNNPKLLLHACCAPCSSHVIEVLSPEWDVTVYFYNPNIAPVSEYQIRLGELKNYSRARSFPLIEGSYDNKSWTRAVKDLRFYGERSERCHRCFELRLRETFRMALEMRMDAVATVLSVSPHKDAEAINRIGRALEQEFPLKYLDADFKKKDGYKRSVEISREHNFYRQRYCGCGYSRLERDGNSLWNKKRKEFLTGLDSE